jgi:hypothetical protein
MHDVFDQMLDHLLNHTLNLESSRSLVRLPLQALRDKSRPPSRATADQQRKAKELLARLNVTYNPEMWFSSLPQPKDLRGGLTPNDRLPFTAKFDQSFQDSLINSVVSVEHNTSGNLTNISSRT